MAPHGLSIASALQLQRFSGDSFSLVLHTPRDFDFEKSASRIFWSGLSRCSRQSPVTSCVVSRAASPLLRSRAVGGLCGGRAVGLTSVDNPVGMCGGAPCYRLASCVSHVQIKDR